MIYIPPFAIMEDQCSEHPWETLSLPVLIADNRYPAVLQHILDRILDLSL